jgi:hypothetical protein
MDSVSGTANIMRYRHDAINSPPSENLLNSCASLYVTLTWLGGFSGCCDRAKLMDRHGAGTPSTGCRRPNRFRGSCCCLAAAPSSPWSSRARATVGVCIRICLCLVFPTLTASVIPRRRYPELRAKTAVVDGIGRFRAAVSRPLRVSPPEVFEVSG